MKRLLRWYGASPLHLLVLLACFGLAGYAAARLVSSHPVAVIVWFLGAVIGHDLLLMPLYSLADRSALAAVRHREPQLPATPWINYVRVPAALSGLLLLVWFPLILRLQSPYHASTTLSADPYVWHWLAVTGALFGLSAVAFALRLRRQSRTATPPERPAAASEEASPERETGPQAGTVLPQAGPGEGEQPAVVGDQRPALDTGEAAASGAVAGDVQRESRPGPQQAAAGEDQEPPDQTHHQPAAQHEAGPGDEAG
ncbi:MAG: hypothetical protein WAK82_24075 [Streptosporangiaceae bacterium]